MWYFTHSFLYYDATSYAKSSLTHIQPIPVYSLYIIYNIILLLQWARSLTSFGCISFVAARQDKRFGFLFSGSR